MAHKRDPRWNPLAFNLRMTERRLRMPELIEGVRSILKDKTPSRSWFYTALPQESSGGPKDKKLNGAIAKTLHATQKRFWK